jgi:hypothetical protein
VSVLIHARFGRWLAAHGSLTKAEGE